MTMTAMYAMVSERMRAPYRPSSRRVTPPSREGRGFRRPRDRAARLRDSNTATTLLGDVAPLPEHLLQLDSRCRR